MLEYLVEKSNGGFHFCYYFRLFILAGKPGVKRPLRRPTCRWEDTSIIKIYLTESGWDGMDWLELAQDRDQLRVLVNTVMKLRVP
jgi:hypothetical protein